MATTGGTGGPLTDGVSGWWAATNGYSSKYRWWCSHIDTSQPVGIFVWFHGDGAYEYNNPTDTAYLGGPDGILQACIEQNMILVVPLSPDDEGTITWWEWGSKTGNAQWVKEMIHANFYNRYNIDRGRIWFGGFSGGAEFLTAQFLPHWGNDLLIEAGGAVITGGGTFHSDYGGDPTFNPAYKANFRMYWRTGEDDTAANSDEGFDGVLAAQTGEAWYRNKGFPTDIALVPGKSHLLTGLYGGYVREALADTGGPTQPGASGMGAFVGSKPVLGVYVGSTPVPEVYVGSQKIWPTRERVQITLGPGEEAADQLLAALWARGLDEKTVTEIPFDIELVGTGSAQNMFYFYESLTHAPVMDTSNVTDMRSMFGGCNSLVYVPDMNTSNVTHMAYMFYGCESLTDGNVRLIGRYQYVDTHEMIKYSRLTREPFYDPDPDPGPGDGPGDGVVQITLGSGLEARDQLRAALSARGLGYQTVTEIPFEIELVGSGSVQDMFTDCSALTTAPEMDTSQVTNMSYMFDRCAALTLVPDMHTSNVTNMTGMFYGCSSLTDQNVRLVGRHPNVVTTSMIIGSGLTRLPFYDSARVRITLGTGTQARDQLRAALTDRGLDYSTVTEIPFEIALVGTGSTQSMFKGCSALTSVPAMATSQVTNMRGMFEDCSALKSVPAMATSQVTNMSYMFADCVSLKTVPAMDTSKVTNMNSMFENCESLTYVPAMDTSKATGMIGTFSYCSSLTDGNVRLLGLHPQVDTSYMLIGSGLTREPFHLEVVRISKATGNSTSARDAFRAALSNRGWNYQTIARLPFEIELIGSGNSVFDLFAYCSALKSVPSISLPGVTTTRGMFHHCTSLTSVGDLQTSNVSNTMYMFWECSSLRDFGVHLIGKHPNVETAVMIAGSGLTREPFYNSFGNPI
jgi:hypothetical protein